MDDAAQAILIHLLKMQISANKGCLIDSTFGESHVEVLNKIFKHLNYKPIQVVCYAEKNILKERYYNRSINNLRHPGHLDNVLADSFEKINSRFNVTRPLNLNSSNFEVDTSANNDKEIKDIILSIDSFNILAVKIFSFIILQSEDNFISSLYILLIFDIILGINSLYSAIGLGFGIYGNI